jgi:hypothetical protein
MSVRVFSFLKALYTNAEKKAIIKEGIVVIDDHASWFPGHYHPTQERALSESMLSLEYLLRAVCVVSTL